MWLHLFLFARVLLSYFISAIGTTWLALFLALALLVSSTLETLRRINQLHGRAAMLKHWEDDFRTGLRVSIVCMLVIYAPVFLWKITQAVYDDHIALVHASQAKSEQLKAARLELERRNNLGNNVGMLSYEGMTLKAWALRDKKSVDVSFTINMHNLQPKLIRFYVDKIDIDIDGYVPVDRYLNRGVYLYPNQSGYFTSIVMHDGNMKKPKKGKIVYLISYHVEGSNEVHHTGKTVFINEIRYEAGKAIVSSAVTEEHED